MNGRFVQFQIRVPLSINKIQETQTFVFVKIQPKLLLARRSGLSVQLFPYMCTLTLHYVWK